MTKSFWLAMQFSHLAVHKTYKLPWLIRIYVSRKWGKSFDCPERKDGIIMAILRMFRDSAFELKKLRCITVTAMLIALNLALKTATINITDDLKISFSFLALAAIGMLFGPTVSFLSGAVTDILGLLIANTIGAFNPLFTLVEAVGGMLYGLFLYKLKPIKFDKETFKPVVEQNTMLLSGINAKLVSLLIIGSVAVLKYTYDIDNLFVIYAIIAAVLYGCFLYRLAVLPWKQLLRIIGAKFSVAVICNIIMTPFIMLISDFWTWEVMWAVKIPGRLLKNAIQVPLDCVLLMIVLFPIMVAYNRIFKNQNVKERKNKTK